MGLRLRAHQRAFRSPFGNLRAQFKFRVLLCEAMHFFHEIASRVAIVYKRELDRVFLGPIIFSVNYPFPGLAILKCRDKAGQRFVQRVSLHSMDLWYTRLFWKESGIPYHHFTILCPRWQERRMGMTRRLRRGNGACYPMGCTSRRRK